MYLHEKKELVSFLCFGESEVERIICHDRGRQRGGGGSDRLARERVASLYGPVITPPG